MPSDTDTRLHIVLENDAEQLAPAMERIRAFLDPHGALPAAVYAIETAFEEMVTNIVK